MSKLSETIWHGQPAWALESDDLRVITVPGMGAKIVSLFNKTAEHEWLLGPADRPFEPVDYGASFVDQDMSGWDEMFPTIDADTYPLAGPYKDAFLPEHGEVWAIPWQIVETGPKALTLQVAGRALPYQLTRTLSLPDVHTLRMDYVVENTGAAPLAGFWTAHPQFTATPSTEICLPDTIESVWAVHLTDWDATGTQLEWPVATGPDEHRIRLNRVTSAALQRSHKVYVLPDESIAWARLIETNAQHWLHMAWDPAQVPYVGIWVDEGNFSPALAIALEPSTGYYDKLSRAVENDRVPVLQPGETQAWSLSVKIGTN